MKKNFELKKFSIEKIKHLCLDRANRCGETNEENAKEMGYSSIEYAQFISRAEKLAKDIAKNGWMEDSVMTIGKCITPGLEGLYLIDGQGRRGAIILLEDSENGDKLPQFVNVHYYNNLTIEEIREKMRTMNTKPVLRWSSENKRACEAKMMGGEVENSYNIIKAYQSKIGCAYYLAELFHYGERATHSLSKSDVMLTSNDFIENYKLYTESYLKFVENAGSEYVKNGCITEKQRKDHVIRTDIGIILFSLFNWNKEMCKRYNLNINDYLTDFVDRLIKKTNTTSTPSGKWKEAMKVNKKYKDVFSKGFRIHQIVDALYGKKENESIREDVLNAFELWTCGVGKY